LDSGILHQVSNLCETGFGELKLIIEQSEPHFVSLFIYVRNNNKFQKFTQIIYIDF
jgi:hypothetical protein